MLSKVGWQPRKSVLAMAGARGRAARKIKADNGCYELKNPNAEGRKILALLDPTTWP